MKKLELPFDGWYSRIKPTLSVIGWGLVASCVLVAAVYFNIRLRNLAPQPVKTVVEYRDPFALSPAARYSAQYIKAHNPKTPLVVAERFAYEVHKQAYAMGYDPSLFIAMGAVESCYNPFSVSSKNARGILQVIGGSHEIDQNVAQSLLIFKEKLAKAKGNVEAALQLYSGGAKGFSDKVLVGVGRYTLGLREAGLCQ